MNRLTFKCEKCKKYCESPSLQGCRCGGKNWVSVFADEMRKRALEVING